MTHYRVKEVKITPTVSYFYPQYKEDGCAGYFNPNDSDAVNGITEWQTFPGESRHLDIDSAMYQIRNYIIAHKNHTGLEVVYHPIDPGFIKDIWKL
jgi:hypothetical protein